MGERPTLTELNPALLRFARRLRDEIGVERVLLYGPHAIGRASRDLDYNLIVVSRYFQGTRPIERGVGLRRDYYSGADVVPLNVLYVTPEEFEQAQHGPTLIRAVLPEAIDLLTRTEPEPEPAETTP